MVQLLFSIYGGLDSNPDLSCICRFDWISNLIVLIELWIFYLQYFCKLITKDLFLPKIISLNRHDASASTSLDHTEESHFGSFSCPLSPFNPSICFFFFPKQCVSDTCNIPVAGVSARDLLLDLSLLTLSATCPLFLWGFYYKTAIAPLINTRYKFKPSQPWPLHSCGPLGLQTPFNTECNMWVVFWNKRLPSKRGVEARASRRGSPVSC